MKKLVILILITLSVQGYSQENQIVDIPKVDKRVELLSIVFRLAGNSEYNNTFFKLYTDKIEQHFSPYKNHKLIKFAEKLSVENEISYNAVMSMAVHLDEKLNPRVEFEKSSLNKRWEKADVAMFVKLLQSFYNDAKCEAFFKDNERLYHEAAIRFFPVFDMIDLDWYSSFYGDKPSEKFIIILALGIGNNNYSADYQKNSGSGREVYAIVGAWNTDDSGMVDYEEEINSYFPTLVHEFNHSFVNPLLDKNKEFFRVNGDKIFKILETEMRTQAFNNWKTVLDEALVRASVVRYLIDHDFDMSTIESLLNFEISNSFLWIRNLVDEFEKYNSNRNLYPTLEKYIPNLAEAYNSFAEIVVQFDLKRPVLECISEFENGDLNVNVEIGRAHV